MDRMDRHITRRKAAAALFGGTPVLAGAAQQAAKAESDPLEQARKDVQETSAKLAEFQLEMNVEPAFVFKP